MYRGLEKSSSTMFWRPAEKYAGAWVAQLVKRPTSAQLKISRLLSLSPVSGSVLADSLEPGACFGFCVSPSLCPSPAHTLSLSKINKHWGAWVAQSVEHLTLAQVMVSQFVGLSPASGSVLTAQNLEPPSDSVSPPLSTPPMLMLCLCLSIINKR